MSAIFRNVPLRLDTYVDKLAFFTVLTGISALAPLDLGGSGGAVAQSVTLTVRVTPTDPAPLLTVSTTPSPSGVITLGVAQPPPVGAGATNEASLQAVLAQGVPTLSRVTPQPVAASYATVAAMAASSTTGVAQGTVAMVIAGVGSFYSWAPASTLTPNGSTIVASTSSTVAGNWLLCTTLTVQIAAAALLPLVGTSEALWDCTVTWAGGAVTKLFEGSCYVDQSETE